MKEKCSLNVMCIDLDVLDDIQFFHRSTVTCFPIFDIRNACFRRRNNAMNMLGKNRGFDLNAISKQVDSKRMLFN